ncbi:hypothetical protein AB3329_01645 [Streptococcus sp. H31]
MQKVETNSEKSIRYQLNPVDMDDLAIPAGMQDYLLTIYKDAIDFTTNTVKQEFGQQMAPMEGYKKQ